MLSVTFLHGQKRFRHFRKGKGGNTELLGGKLNFSKLGGEGPNFTH